MDLTPAKEPPRPLLLVETFSDVPGAHHRDLGFERDLEALGASIIPLALLSVHQGSEKQLGENSKPAPPRCRGFGVMVDGFRQPARPASAAASQMSELAIGSAK